MSNILEFPTKSVSEWNGFDESIKGALIEAGYSIGFIKVIIERMQVVYKEHDFNYNFSFSLPEMYSEQITNNLREFSKANQERTSQLILSRVKLEVELAKLQGFK